MIPYTAIYALKDHKNQVLFHEFDSLLTADSDYVARNLPDMLAELNRCSDADIDLLLIVRGKVEWVRQPDPWFLIDLENGLGC